MCCKFFLYLLPKMKHPARRAVIIPQLPASTRKQTFKPKSVFRLRADCLFMPGRLLYAWPKAWRATLRASGEKDAGING